MLLIFVSLEKDTGQPKVLLTQKRKNWAATSISSKNHTTSAKKLDEHKSVDHNQFEENVVGKAS